MERQLNASNDKAFNRKTRIHVLLHRTEKPVLGDT